jgi:hypothetical protein
MPAIRLPARCRERRNVAKLNMIVELGTPREMSIGSELLYAIVASWREPIGSAIHANALAPAVSYGNLLRESLLIALILVPFAGNWLAALKAEGTKRLNRIEGQVCDLARREWNCSGRVTRPTKWSRSI